MSKQVDATKIERIQEAAIALVSRNGVANASVALIAREAGVSTGYLYRHYAGKEELLNDLLDKILTRINDRIASLLEERKIRTEGAMESLIRFIFETAEQQPDHIRFCLNLQNDVSCPISEQVVDRLKKLCRAVLRQGREAGIFDRRVTAEDLYIIMLCVPLQYIGVRIRGIFGSFKYSDAEVRHVSAICLSAIKN